MPAAVYIGLTNEVGLRHLAGLAGDTPATAGMQSEATAPDSAPASRAGVIVATDGGAVGLRWCVYVG